MMAIVPRSLDVQAADVLREEILNGTLAPGSRLLEIELSERLNLSRGTIRSALQQLVYEGLIVQFPYRGCVVAGLTAQDAWELYTLRSALESLAARLAATSIRADKANQLKTALQQLKAAANQGWKEVVEADFALHKTILNLSEHHRLQAQYQIISSQIQLYIASCNALNPDLEEIIQQHESLVAAICSGDAELAEKIAREHNTDGQMLVEHLQRLEKENRE
jgi:DNA-binding GntR family transcriptional regulator